MQATFLWSADPKPDPQNPDFKKLMAEISAALAHRGQHAATHGDSSSGSEAPERPAAPAPPFAIPVRPRRAAPPVPTQSTSCDSATDPGSSAGAAAAAASAEPIVDYTSDYEGLTPPALTADQQAAQVPVPRGWRDPSLDDPAALIEYLSEHDKEINHRDELERHVHAAWARIGAPDEIEASFEALQASSERLDLMSRLSELAQTHRLSIAPEDERIFKAATQAHQATHRKFEREMMEKLANTRFYGGDVVDSVVDRLRHATTQSAGTPDNAHTIERATQELSALLSDLDLSLDGDRDQLAQLLQSAQELLAARQRKRVPINPMPLHEMVTPLAAIKKGLGQREAQQQAELKNLQAELAKVLAALRVYAEADVAQRQGLIDLDDGSGDGLAADDERDKRDERA